MAIKRIELADIDITNKWGIGWAGPGQVSILLPPVTGRLTRQEALVFAAWLIGAACLGDGMDDVTFDQIFEEVQNS